MAVDHVEVALGDGDVDRLADRSAGMVERRREIGELHEIAEVLDRRITPPLIEIANEGRAVDRREDQVAAADLDVPCRVPGALGEGARRRLDQRAHEPSGKAHALAFDLGAGTAPQVERFRIVAEVDADLLKDGLGIVLDEGQAFLGQHLIERDLPLDIGELRARSGT